MSHALLLVPNPDFLSADTAFDSACAVLSRFKRVALGDVVRTRQAQVTVAPAAQTMVVRPIHRSPDGQIILIDLGTWLPLPAEPGRDGAWLIAQYQTYGIESLARRLQGFFALMIIDQRTGQTYVITDRCGSLHVFYQSTPDGYLVCTSSGVLGQLGAGRLDPVGLHEFIATGIIYEDRTLWADVHKVPPATVMTFAASRMTSRLYWSFTELAVESLSLDDAVDATHSGLLAVLQALPQTSKPLVSDLTGGYDSRFLLAGLLASGRAFETTVSGPAESPDVQVAGRIAGILGLKHSHVPPNSAPTAEAFETALQMTDGEYDAFDYARILHTHQGLSARYSMSLNGSFGELARGYWWELLWPHLGQRRPLDPRMIARRRFAAFPYDASVFAATSRLDLCSELAAVAARVTAPLAHVTNTTQLDCVYFTLRMQRWQGRIASTTNQLWAAFSPIGFAQVLDPILTAKARTRFRSLLVRRLFARHAPVLAKIPLEHGYPPTPATLFNFWRFYPLLGYYGGKVYGRIAGRLGPVPPVSSVRPLTLRERPDVRAAFPELEGASVFPMHHALASGLLDEEALREFMDPTRVIGGARLDQWRRLATLERLLACLEGTA